MNATERLIAAAILSNSPQKKEADFRPLTKEVMIDWKSGSPNVKSGGPAPKMVRLGCQVLTRAGFSETAESLADVGAYGYWLQPCIPLFLYHGLSVKSVRKSIIFEAFLVKLCGFSIKITSSSYLLPFFIQNWGGISNKKKFKIEFRAHLLQILTWSF